jgi:hypothetical protein
MKRIVTLFLATIMVFGLAACEKNGETDCGNIRSGGSPAVNYAPCNY